MFSLSDLAKGCWPLDSPETTPNNEQESDQILSRNNIPAVKEENTDTSYNIVDLETVSVPLELVYLIPSSGEISTHSDVLNIEIHNIRGAYSPNAFVDETSGHQVDGNSRAIQRRLKDGSQTDDQLITSDEVMYPVQGTEVRYPINQSNEAADQRRELSAVYHLSANQTIPACQCFDNQNNCPQKAPSYQTTANMAAPLYPTGTQEEMANPEMGEEETNTCHQAAKCQPPEMSSNLRCKSDESLQRQHLHKCTSSYPCHGTSKTKSSHTPMIGLANQRPSVIMEPVSRNSTVSVESLVPSKGDSRDPDSSNAGDAKEKQEKYFRKNIDGTTTKFTLSEEDWNRIIITTYPRGGRLLSGDWTAIFRAKLRESNPWCQLNFRNNHVISTNSPKRHSAPFFRGSAKCKLPECDVKVRLAIRKENGKYVDVTYVGNICHKKQN